MHGTFTADENINKAIRTCCIKAGLPFFLKLPNSGNTQTQLHEHLYHTDCLRTAAPMLSWLSYRPFFLTERGIDHAQRCQMPAT